MSSMALPATVARYYAMTTQDRHTHPVIVQTFTPGKGWTRTGYRKRVSLSWLRKLRAEGVTSVSLARGDDTRPANPLLADFTVAEILNGGPLR